MTQKDDQTQADPATDDSALVALQHEIDTLKDELGRLRDIAGRAQADLQNAKARVEREGDDLRKFANENMIRRLLPTLDNFQRAFQHIPAEVSAHEWTKGLVAIEQDLMKQMADAGVKRMQSLGASVDPSRHEIITAGPGPIDTVTEVFEEGYELQGKVLRPAKVKVGDGTQK